jgi:hypothetical protein
MDLYTAYIAARAAAAKLHMEYRLVCQLQASKERKAEAWQAFQDAKALETAAAASYNAWDLARYQPGSMYNNYSGD